VLRVVGAAALGPGDCVTLPAQVVVVRRGGAELAGGGVHPRVLVQHQLRGGSKHLRLGSKSNGDTPGTLFQYVTPPPGIFGTRSMGSIN
jgi:hypothetical protein